MKTMEAEELGANIVEVLRQVEEEGQAIEVTRGGQAVARLVPVQSRTHNVEAVRQALVELDLLAAEIGKHWPEGVSAEDAVTDVRGDSW